MPLYTYECIECSTRIEEERTVANRKEMATCGECGHPCELVITPVAGYMKGGPTVPSSGRRKK